MTPTIDWQYFYGFNNNRTFSLYYTAQVNGVRVEKHTSNKGVKYSVGNMDYAKVI